ncbi:hypothetical protein [Bosea sp. RAC05]|uniref:hypothetical protein n=1 Tax=Bosea sp. RAC05 TaxID=1842539 RepID=UPI00085722BF|nr:hypothetical protein [Bosea sp. RAC05]AOG03287.1 hypothetical protein BSY19_5131 [Bosea sp. RAC05]
MTSAASLLAAPMTPAEARAHRIALKAAQAHQLRALDPGFPENGQVADLESACIAYMQAYTAALMPEPVVPPAAVHPVMALASNVCRSAAEYFSKTVGYYSAEDAARSFGYSAATILTAHATAAAQPLLKQYGSAAMRQAMAAAAELCQVKMREMQQRTGAYDRQRVARDYAEMARAIECLSFAPGSSEMIASEVA